MDTLLTRIDTEAASLVRVFFGGDGLVLVALLALVWLVAAAVKKALRLRTGVLSRHPLAHPIVNGVSLVIGVGLIVRYLFRSAPLIITTVLIVSGAAMVFGLSLRARAWLAGLGQVLLSRLHVGDRLGFEGAVGVVERIGLFRLTLRAEGGEIVHLPIAALDGQVFQVSSPERAFPVDVTFHLADNAEAHTITAVRTAARLCPYRSVGSEATVAVDPDDPKRLHVRFRAWSEAAARHAEAYLRARVG